jgi:hypothetical protein
MEVEQGNKISFIVMVNKGGISLCGLNSTFQVTNLSTELWDETLVMNFANYPICMGIGRQFIVFGILKGHLAI